MRETKFIEQNQEKWSDFEEMLQEDRRDPERLNDLFIQITDDLSYARTFYPNRSVRMYLNSLAQKVFHNVYRGKRFPLSRLRSFWTEEVPALMWESRMALLLSFSVFVLACAIGVVSSMINPDFAREVLGDNYVEMTLQNIRDGDPMAVYKDSAPLGMSVGIAANNLFVALRTAIFGVLASVGTLFMLLYNGIMLGAFQYFFIERGLFWESFLTIWIHGTLEIGAIIIAGAAGMVAGSGLLFPGTYTRGQAFQLSMRRGLKIFISLLPIFVLAAFFEGFLTRYTQTPPLVRGLFIGCSLFFMVWYFVWLPYYKYRRGHFANTATERELPPDRTHPILFSTIKNAGEIIADAFTALRRHPKTAFWSILGAAALFTGTALWLSPDKPFETFQFPVVDLGVLAGVEHFFGKEKMGWLLPFHTALLVTLTAGAFIALEQEMPETKRPQRSRLQLVLRAVPLTLPVLVFVWLLRIDPGGLGWFLGLWLCPYAALWAAALWFETPNPFLALKRAFTLMRFLDGILLGIFLVNLGMMFFWFLDSGVWRAVMGFFTWLVTPGEDNLRNFHTIVNTSIACVILYSVFLLMMLGGALQYFSGREIADATGLREGIDQVGTARQIRGLARE